MKKAVCFDLFWTLTAPWFPETDTEYDRAGLTKKEFHDTFEDKTFCRRRNLGEFPTVKALMEEYRRLYDFDFSDSQLQYIADARLSRIEKGLLNVDEKILETIRELKKRGFTIALISNADNFDHCYWEKSPLKELFDYVTFSGKIGCLKPEQGIYETALKKMNLSGQDCYYVGDGGNDELLGAKKAGFTTVFTEYILHKAPELRNHIMESADFIIQDFSELLDLPEIKA